MSHPTPHPSAASALALQQVLAHLRAGDWPAAHDLVQRVSSPLAPWLHGIVHLEEGDLEDAEYWYGQAQRSFRQRGTLPEELAQFEAALRAAGAGPATDELG